mmetsp:Transcript_5337/g.5500  ORF Transcript_5337/g.5500 Transcript_5337/m.5500 type:complete len:138 (+) Transcript_5337:216-629(+)
MDDSDVIEIGEEGAFDIPTTKSYSNGGDRLEESSFNHLTSGITSDQYEIGVQREILSDMKEGQYKVFRKPNASNITVVIKLKESAQVSQLLVGMKHIEVKTNHSTTMRVDLPNFDIDFQTASASSWNEFLSVSLITK